MEAILMEQPFPADTVLLARTEFRIAGTPVECGLVFLPDATGLAPPQSPAAGPRGRP
jgi:hypothetical protein